MNGAPALASIFHSGVAGLLVAALAITALCALQLRVGDGPLRAGGRLAVVAAILSLVAVILIIGRFAALS